VIPSLSSLYTVSFSFGYKHYRHQLANLLQLDAASSLHFELHLKQQQHEEFANLKVRITNTTAFCLRCGCGNSRSVGGERAKFGSEVIQMMSLLGLYCWCECWGQHGDVLIG
jgi:hypothetical protein